MLAARQTPGPARPLRQALRQATRAVHEGLEALWTPHDRFSSQEAYLRFLAALLEAHCQLGVQAAAARGDPEDLVIEHRRIDALCADLGRARPAIRSPTPMSDGFAWGVGYVLNGSTLGAEMILRHGYLGAGWPVRYLALGRDYVRDGHLRRFFDVLNDLPLPVEDVRRGAMDTFAALAPLAAADQPGRQ